MAMNMEGNQCKSPRVSRGDTLYLKFRVSPLLTRGLEHRIKV
jgi:hypothetical protein